MLEFIRWMYKVILTDVNCANLKRPKKVEFLKYDTDFIINMFDISIIFN